MRRQCGEKSVSKLIESCSSAFGAGICAAEEVEETKEEKQRPVRKKSIATIFRESIFAFPNWKTQLASANLSGNVSSDSEDEEEEAVKETKSETRQRVEAEVANDCHGEEEEAADDDDVFAELSEKAIGGFGDATCRFAALKKAPRRATPQLARQTRAIDNCSTTSSLELASSKVAGGESVEPPNLIAASAAKASGDGAHKRRRGKFAYWRLLSSEATTNNSLSFGGSATLTPQTLSSELSYDATLAVSASKTRQSVPASATETTRTRTNETTNKSQQRRRSFGSFSAHLSARHFDELKFIAQRNLVATLIGLYMIVSLIVIVFLMLPYVFRGGNSVAQATGDEPLLGAKTTRQQATQTTNVDDVSLLATQRQRAQNDTHRGGQEKHERAKKLLMRLSQIRVGAENKAKKELDDFGKIWQVQHRTSCQPLKVPFCGRTIKSMFSSISPKLAQSAAQVAALKVGASDAASGHELPLYDKTLIPNQFAAARQSQIESFLEKYEPLVDVRCYALMPLFLCSIYAPKCVQLNQTTAAPAPDANTELVLSTSRTDQIVQVQHGENKSASEQVQLARLVPPCRSMCKGKQRCLGKPCAVYNLNCLTLPFTSVLIRGLPEVQLLHGGALVESVQSGKLRGLSRIKRRECLRRPT